MPKFLFFYVTLVCLTFASLTAAPRAREAGVPFSGIPGTWNAITDVPGVEVGYTTIIEGEGELVSGQGPIRTGVSVILPRGRESYSNFCYGGCFILNGNGETTGMAWLGESGFVEGPIAVTNTLSIGVVRDAIYKWGLQQRVQDPEYTILPIVAETYDGYLNDIVGFHVKDEHVFSCLESAKSGPLEEGNVGSGTGMISFGLKAGIGTASRKVMVLGKEYTVGVWVQSNFGRKHQLTIAGVPIGELLIKEEKLSYDKEGGSIVAIIATDAPLLPHQLDRVAKRSALGVARTGGIGGNSSGDFFLAFSTANAGVSNKQDNFTIETIPNDEINFLFEATIQATEEAIMNALFAAETMEGINRRVVKSIDKAKVIQLLKQHNRFIEANTSGT